MRYRYCVLSTYIRIYGSNDIISSDGVFRNGEPGFGRNAGSENKYDT